MSASATQEQRGRARPYRNYAVVFLVTPIFLLTLLVGGIYVFEKDIPAPHFSTSESFNEKARWIRNFSDDKCDVLIIGSSMALNNIDGSAIKSLTGNRSVINAASWGLSVAESALLLKYIAPTCKPKVIVYAVFPGDFNHDARDEKKINWVLFQDYLAGESPVITYLKSMDALYYIPTFIDRLSYSKKGRSIYQSLAFDGTGSVNFDCRGFEINPSRWDAQNNYVTPPQDRIQQGLAELEHIENIASENHSQLLVVATPLRRVAEEKLATPEITYLWNSVLHSVTKNGGTFINIRASYGFADSQFADFAHLNKCGATKVVEIIAPALTGLLQKEGKRMKVPE